MANPTVSIGLPCFNAEQTIVPTLQSTFAQASDDRELIAVDDGSTDRTPEILRSVNDPRVRVIADAENRRLAARLNQIADEANGEFLARMDADNLMFSGRLGRQLDYLQQNPDCDLLGTAIVTVNDYCEPVGALCPPISVGSAYAVFPGDDRLDESEYARRVVQAQSIPVGRPAVAPLGPRRLGRRFARAGAEHAAGDPAEDRGTFARQHQVLPSGLRRMGSESVIRCVGGGRQAAAFVSFC